MASNLPSSSPVSSSGTAEPTTRETTFDPRNQQPAKPTTRGSSKNTRAASWQKRRNTHPDPIVRFGNIFSRSYSTAEFKFISPKCGDTSLEPFAIIEAKNHTAACWLRPARVHLPRYLIQGSRNHHPCFRPRLARGRRPLTGGICSIRPPPAFASNGTLSDFEF